MDFQIDQPILLKCLSVVGNAVPAKATRLILKTILISAKDNTVLFRASDGNLDISCSVEADVKEEGQVCVDNLLGSVIANFSSDKIRFRLRDKLTVSQKRTHTLAYMDPNDFPAKREIENYQEIEPRPFVKSLKKTAISLSSLPERPILQSYFINPHLNLILTSDGRCLSRFSNVTLPGNISLPDGKMINSFTGILQESDKIEVSLGVWSGIRGQRDDLRYEIIFSSRSGEYPRKSLTLFETYVPNNSKVRVKAEKESIKKILSSCKVYAERAIATGHDPFISISKNGSGTLITMKVPNLAEVEEPLECEYEGPEFSVRIQPIMLLEALGQVESDHVELYFFDQSDPFLVLDPECPDYAYLQAVMK